MRLPTLSTAEATSLARGALGGDVVAVDEVPVGFGSRSWRVVTGDGTFVLKVGPAASAAKWRAAHRALELAAAAGVPVPRLVHFAATDDAVVRAFEWRDGRHPSALAGRPHAVERLAADLGAALAALHDVAVGGFSSRLDGSAPSFDRWSDYLAHRLGQIRARARASGAPDPRTLDRACAEVDRLAREVDAAAGPALCHRDLHSDNLLVRDDGRLVAILDWDMAEAWDAAGEWFKLDFLLFPALPGLAGPFHRAYRAARDDGRLWDRRTRLVDILESTNAVANAPLQPWGDDFGARALVRLQGLLDAGRP